MTAIFNFSPSSVRSALQRLSLLLCIALTACSSTPTPSAQSTPPVSSDWQRHSAVARQAFTRGDLPQAERSFLLAAAAAQASDQPGLTALTHYHLALLHYSFGDLAAARTDLDRAEHSHTLAAEPLPAAAIILRARIELAEGHFAEAIHLSRQLLADSVTADEQAAARLILARCALFSNDSDTAENLLDSVTAQPDLPAMLQADATRLRGDLLSHSNHPSAAAAAYEAAADFYATEHAWIARAECRASAAAAWQQAGEPQRARAAWQRAIHAAEALQRPDLAAEWQRQGASSSEESSALR